MKDLTSRACVERELMLIKVKCESHFRQELLEIVNIFRAKVVDLSFNSLTIQIVGDPGKIIAMQQLLNTQTLEDILKYKIGYTSEGEFGGRVVVPSFDEEGDLNYFVARSYDGNWPRYKNPPTSRDVIFNELTVDWDSDLILVEGIFDAINAGNAIPILGSSLRPTSKLFKAIVMNDTPVFMALDNDAKEKENRIINDLLKYDVEVYKIDTSGYDDVGEMPKQVFKDRKKGAEFVSADSYMLYEAIGSI